MTDAKRDELRKLQDDWLKVPAVQVQILKHGWDRPITGNLLDPTFRAVKIMVLPRWERWFRDFLAEV